MRLKPKRSRSELIVDVESLIGSDDEIRLIDDFVEKLDLSSYGINYKTAHEWGKDKGGPSEYDPKDLIRIYLYGYLNKVRGSRDLEEGCKKNIDLIWLINGQKPSHGTISNFRSNHPEGLFEIYKSLNILWQKLGLFSEPEDGEESEVIPSDALAKLAEFDSEQTEAIPSDALTELEESDSAQIFAIDGSKFGGQNSKTRNYNVEKLEKNLERYNKKAAAYLEELANLDGEFKSDPARSKEEELEKKS